MLLSMHPRLVIALLLTAMATVSAGQTSNHAEEHPRGSSTELRQPTVPNLPDANPEVLQLAIQDQWDRGNDMFGGGKPIPPPDMHGKSSAARDEEREHAVRKLLVDGKLKSGTDFWLSALIFQHSIRPEGVLLAHVLAATATAKGNGNAKWLAAASLDRYLWDVNQPQVFGTQFKKSPDGKWTMEPYARGTFSDAERAIWCVVPVSEQEKILAEFQAGKPLASTGIRDCN